MLIDILYNAHFDIGQVIIATTQQLQVTGTAVCTFDSDGATIGGTIWGDMQQLNEYLAWALTHLVGQAHPQWTLEGFC